jgi:hypothetical protein
MSAEERAYDLCRRHKPGVGCITCSVITDEIRAAERAAVEATHREWIVELGGSDQGGTIPHLAIRNCKAGLEAVFQIKLTALADAFGLPERECPCRFHKSGHIDESHERTCQCKGTGTLPWDVESLREALCVRK